MDITVLGKLSLSMKGPVSWNFLAAQGLVHLQELFSDCCFWLKAPNLQMKLKSVFFRALEYGILSLSVKTSKTINIIIQIINRNISLSKQVNQVLNNMMQIEFSINSLAVKIQCNLHFGFVSLCSVLHLVQVSTFLTVFLVICYYSGSVSRHF